MTREELIKKIDAEITKLYDNANQMCIEDGGYRVACRDISDMLRKIAKEIQPYLPSDLDEAAEESMPEAEGFLEIDIYGGSEAVYSREQMLAMFKSGAEWMAGQGETFETIMQEDDVDELVPTCPDMQNHGYSCGDKVIVQIRKKQ